MSKRRWTRAGGGVAVLAIAVSFSSVSVPQVPEHRRRAAEGVPEGFEPVPLPELDEVRRRRADKIRTDVEISNELRRYELDRAQQRAGRRAPLFPNSF